MISTRGADGVRSGRRWLGRAGAARRAGQVALAVRSAGSHDVYMLCMCGLARWRGDDEALAQSPIPKTAPTVCREASRPRDT